MSFKLSKQKKLKGKDPIAKIKGGKNHNMYLYLSDFVFKLDDIPEDMIKHLSQKERDELNDCLKSGYEPEDENLTKLMYECKKFIKTKNCKFILRDTQSKFMYMPSRKVIERCLICGISGSGKSTWASSYIKQWRKEHGGNSKNRRPFYIVSNLDEDEVLDKLDPVRLDPEDIAYNGVSIEEDPDEDEDSLFDSLLLCDDIDTIENVAVRKATRSFLNNMLEISRHYKTYILITAHVIQNNYVSRVQLNEANVVVLFPKNNTRAVRNYLKSYEYFTEEQIDRILNINSRWVALVKHYFPVFILTERQCYVV